MKLMQGFYNNQSKRAMYPPEKASIQRFKKAIDYEACIAIPIPDYDELASETPGDKQRTSKSGGVRENKMTKEELDAYSAFGKRITDKWDQQMKKKDKEEDDNTSLMSTSENKVNAAPLHDMTCIGVDTCSARSISCLKEDFLDLEITQRHDREDQLRGVGGTSGVAGKGCLIFYALDLNGKMKAVIEPKGVYLENPPAKFRIIGQQRMKKNGLCAIQDYDDAGTDILKCMRGGTILPLTEGNGILLLKMIPYQPEERLKQQLKSYVQRIKMGNSFLPHVVDLDELKEGSETVLILNEGKLKRENYERLLHWRLGHTNSKALQSMDIIEKSHLNEDCFCCNEAKFKRAPFPKNEGAFVAVAEPYWRLYVDGFGGQKSLGCESVAGAKGGIICVCPVSGSIILKLYASFKEFPAILYQILQDVERQGFVCREVMVDTFVVNLSAAVEEVAAMFRTRIIPISAGTPQELAYAERAVRCLPQHVLLCTASTATVQ